MNGDQSSSSDASDAGEIGIPTQTSRQAHFRVAVVHVPPLERYPPVMNALNFFGQQPDLEVTAISAETPPNQKPFESEAIRIHRIRLHDAKASKVKNALHAFRWHWSAARILASWQPDVILYWDPQSALACYLCLRWMSCRAKLFVHHHEYHSPEDLRRPGMRVARVGHFFERKWLFRNAIWVSQTNPERMKRFRQDVPNLVDQQARILPNYPPASWSKAPRTEWGGCPAETLRLVYVGSLSLNDTFIGPLVDWLIDHPAAGMTLDIFTNNCEQKTLEFLKNASGSIVRVHERGVEYERIPDVLAEFDVGLVLYRCRTVNYQFNASNKLFEYLMCDLDVWYPPVMLGVKPFARLDTFPRVIEVDFEDLDTLDVDVARSRKGLREEPWTETCESQLELLATEMRHAVLGSEHQSE